MKVLLLLSLILVVCYSHTRLRTHPLIQPISDQYPYQPDVTTSQDNAQLDLQRTFPATKETQLHSLRQDFDILDTNLTGSPNLPRFNTGINFILDDAQRRGFIGSTANFTSIATSLQRESKRNSADIYRFQFRSDNRRGATIIGYFNIRDGATTLDSYNYDTMTVTDKAVTQGPYLSQDTNLVGRADEAYREGLRRIQELLVSNGDVDAGVSLASSLTSAQLQVTDSTDNSYQFQVTLNQNTAVVVTATFTIATRQNDPINYFTDYSYYVQKNRLASVSADPVESVAVTQADSGPVQAIFNEGVRALTDIAISQGDLTQNGVLTKKVVTNIQSQQDGVNKNYIFQAILTSNQNSTFAVNLVVAAYYNGTNKLTAFAYNVLSNTSYATPASRDVVTLNAPDAKLPPHNDTLRFGVDALLAAAKARGDLLSNFPNSFVDVTAFQSQIISQNEITYTFQVNLTDNNGTSVAASISVTIRNNAKILTAYAYNIMNTTSVKIKSASSITLDTILAQNGTGADFLEFGVERVKELAIQRGDIANGTVFIRAIVLKLQKQTTGNDLAYIFQANLDNGQGVILAASFSVTLRAHDGQKYLTAYAYNQQVTTTAQVYPYELKPMNALNATNNATINEALNFGLSQIIGIAINNTHLSSTFQMDNSTYVTISLKNQTIGSDFAYYFQVRFGDGGSIIFSASFTVTIRFHLSSKVLSAYAYTIQTSNVTNVQAQAPQTVLVSELRTNQDLNDSLTVGLTALTSIAIHNGDLRRNDSIVSSSTTTIKRVITGNDVTYIFQVYANTTNRTQLSASLSVTTRPSYTLGKILTGYAYIIQDTNIERVGPLPSNLTEANADQAAINRGVELLKEIAVAARHIPANYTFNREIRNFSAVETKRDITYIFQVYLKGTTGDPRNVYQLQLAATISVTKRSVNNTVYLTAYAYNVLNATIILNAPGDFTPVSVSEQTNPRVKRLLDYGADLVKSLSQRNNDLVNASNLTAQSVVSIRTQNQAPDYSYSFQVEFSNHQGAGLAATFTVTYRDVDSNLILVNYAYNSLNTTLGSVSTRIEGNIDRSDPNVATLFDVGCRRIVLAAKANGQVAANSNFTSFIISGQNVTLGGFSGFQFQANLDDGDGTTIGAAFTVVAMDQQYGGNVVSNYAYNTQIVKKRTFER